MNNSSSLTATIHEAHLAAQQQNWFQVECYLQQVCLSRELENIDGKIAQQALDLALEVLLEGDFPKNGQ